MKVKYWLYSICLLLLIGLSTLSDIKKPITNENNKKFKKRINKKGNSSSWYSYSSSGPTVQANNNQSNNSYSWSYSSQGNSPINISNPVISDSNSNSNSNSYSYSYRKAGQSHVENMKRLAVSGSGLNSYINAYIKFKYD